MTLCACNGVSKQQQKKQPQQLKGHDEEDKIPKQLEDIEASIENIIKKLKGPSSTETGRKDTMEENPGDAKDINERQQNGSGEQNPEEEQKEKANDEQEDKENEEDKEQDNQKENQQSGVQEQDSFEKDIEETKDPWLEIDKTINKLHYQWNGYIPLAMDKNANHNLIDGFGVALNSLTNTIISKNETNTLLAASYLYSFVPDLYALYRTQSSPEIKRIKYYTRNAMLNAMTANWVQADTDVKSLESTWEIYKNFISEKKQEQLQQLDYSILEFRKVVNEKNQPLCDIKGRVAMSNIQAFEESSEEEDPTDE